LIENPEKPNGFPFSMKAIHPISLERPSINLEGFFVPDVSAGAKAVRSAAEIGPTETTASGRCGATSFKLRPTMTKK
jgi:hypothetical protein